MVKKFETLQNGVHEIREQLKMLEQQQANNSDIVDLQENNYRSKLKSLEMRLDDLFSNHAMLSQSIADCSNKENSNLVLKDDELQEKIQKIINDLLDTKKVDTEQNESNSKKDPSEEKKIQYPKIRCNWKSSMYLRCGRTMFLMTLG